MSHKWILDLYKALSSFSISDLDYNRITLNRLVRKELKIDNALELTRRRCRRHGRSIRRIGQ